jgi:hypothetical protein
MNKFSLPPAVSLIYNSPEVLLKNKCKPINIFSNQYDIQFESQVSDSKPISVKFQSHNILEITAKELGPSTITFTYTSQP